MANTQIKLLARLLEVTRSLSAMVDLETYLQSLLSAAMDLTDSKAAAILEYDEISQEFCYKYVPWFQRDTLLNLKVPASGSVAGQVFTSAKPLTVNDLKDNPLYALQLSSKAAFDARSILGAPIKLGDKNFGVLEVFNKEKPYQPQDVESIQALAALAALALQNDMLGRQIESARGEARELEKLKSDFIAITSHELRTPLGLILGHATFLRETVSKEHQEQVETIIRSASKLKEIIESLSNMDNQQSGSATLRERKVSIARIIEDVALSFQDMAAQKGIDLKVEKDPSNELWIEGDVGKLSIALSNLVKNALAFTPKGGHVFILGEVEGSFVKISVLDDGKGIPVKDQPHIFERFYQVESHLTRRHGGMGLGLSVAKGMIEMHGGQIWLESKEGVGSKFSFILPMNSADGAPSSSPFV